MNVSPKCNGSKNCEDRLDVNWAMTQNPMSPSELLNSPAGLTWEAHNRHCLTLHEGHFWQVVVDLLTYHLFILILCFFWIWRWRFFCVLQPSLISFLRITIEDCKSGVEWGGFGMTTLQLFSFLWALRNIVTGASGGWIIFLAGSVVLRRLITLSIGEI